VNSMGAAFSLRRVMYTLCARRTPGQFAGRTRVRAEVVMGGVNSASRGGRFLLRCGQHVDAPALTVEHDHAIDQREEGVVAPAADVAARVILGAALPDDDSASADRLATEELHTQPLALGVAPVPDRALPFLMSHRVAL